MLLHFNDYDNTFEGCLFSQCQFGICEQTHPMTLSICIASDSKTDSPSISHR